jgi:hypothetical protein
MTTMEKIPIEQCERGRIYRILCRNLRYGVFDGDGGFLGIRQKFDHRYLFTEYHVDIGGTVRKMEATDHVVPQDISIQCSLGTVDIETRRPVKFDKPKDEGGKGWCFADTGEASDKIMPSSLGNPRLKELLEGIEKEHD